MEIYAILGFTWQFGYKRASVTGSNPVKKRGNHFSAVPVKAAA
jgi:hypothetical protein